MMRNSARHREIMEDIKCFHLKVSTSDKRGIQATLCFWCGGNPPAPLCSVCNGTGISIIVTDCDGVATAVAPTRGRESSISKKEVNL